MLELDTIIQQLAQVNDYLVSYEECKIIIKQLSINPTFPIILVGGTNGKGSVCNYISTILSEAGYKVGLYTSPHLFTYNERIKINNADILSESLCIILKKIISQNINLGIFKTFTLASMLYFIEQKINIAVIEVGVGGGKDITNLFEPFISAITNITLDHCNILGNDVETIALEKSQIFRTNNTCFYGDFNAPKSLINYAHKINCNLMLFGEDFGYNLNDNLSIWIKDHIFYCIPLPYLRGHEQLKNVTLAIAIVYNIKDSFPLALQHIKQGVIKTRLMGRFQSIPGELEIILDVAHNEGAVSNLMYNIKSLVTNKQNIAVFGIANDKDYKQIIKIGKYYFSKWYIAKLNSTKSRDIFDIYNTLIENDLSEQQIIICNNIQQSFIEASNFANTMRSKFRIVAFGSFDVVRNCLTIINKVRN